MQLCPNQSESLDYQNLFNDVDIEIIEQKGFNYIKIGKHGSF